MAIKTYARIEHDVVVELLATNGDISAMFHRDLHWVDASTAAGIAYGWTYDGKNFSPPSSADNKTGGAVPATA